MISEKYSISFNTKTDICTSADYRDISRFSKNRNTIVISDSNLFKLYPDFFYNKNHIILNHGEEFKNLDTIRYIYNKLIEFNTDRSSLIIGFGGGMVCDMAGFAAATFMRGIKFGFVPSTLLAQIDAAIGGKNGVNFNNVKNYIGTFANPEFIICDNNLLKTLPSDEYKNGFGEVIKYALISDSNFYDFILKNHDLIIEQNIDILNYIIKKCIEIKINYIEDDPTDLGIRHILNFGHSLGHCFEIVDNLQHGIAVVKGIASALDLSLKLNYTNSAAVDSVKGFMYRLGYDITYKLTPKHFDLLIKDKKKNTGAISFIFFRDIGDVFISSIEFDDIIKAFR